MGEIWLGYVFTRLNLILTRHVVKCRLTWLLSTSGYRSHYLVRVVSGGSSVEPGTGTGGTRCYNWETMQQIGFDVLPSTGT